MFCVSSISSEVRIQFFSLKYLENCYSQNLLLLKALMFVVFDLNIMHNKTFPKICDFTFIYFIFTFLYGIEKVSNNCFPSKIA